MVIVQITGGLGNQLFMYAAARRLSLHHGTTLKLDASPYRTYSMRCYLLDRFHIVQDLALPEDLAPFPLTGTEESIRRQPGFEWNPRPYVRQSRDSRHCIFYASDILAGTYLPDILHTTSDVYLDGYWQSELYFKPIEQVIRDDLRLKSDLAGENLATAQQIRCANAVSLHIRRGDYATHPNVINFLGTLPLDYYQRSIAYLATNVGTPHVFVFSDDPDWAKDNLRIGFPTHFVAHNGPEAPHEDLRLMSLCRHHVIANSSLSWWGAWLCQDRNKTVIAPARWFRELPMPDIVPESWIRL